MSQYKEELLYWKSHRTETARKIKALANKTCRILAKEIVPDTSLTDILLELDNLFTIFIEEHNEFSTYVDYVEQANPGEGKRVSVVNGKTLEEYFQDVKKYTKDSTKELKTAIKNAEAERLKLEQQKEAEKQRKKELQEAENLKLEQHKVAKADKNTRRIMRSVANNFAQLGVNQAELEQLESWNLSKLERLKVRIEIIQNSLQELDNSIEVLEKMGGSAVHELLENAQLVSDQTRDELDLISNEVQLLLKEKAKEKPKINSEEPQGLPHKNVEGTPRGGHKESQEGEDSTQTPRFSTLPPGLEHKARRASSIELEQSLFREPDRNPQKMFKYQAMQFPVFSGKRRDWPAFKAAWKFCVEAQGFNKYYLAQQLKTSVKNTVAANMIKAITIRDHTSYDRMWFRLENFYQEQAAVLASIYADLDKLKPCRAGNHKEVIDFVNDLEVIHEQLFSISENHPKKVDCNRIDKLARCLPDEARRDWDRCYYRLDQEEKESPFSAFVLFCTEERATRLRFLDTEHESKRTSVHSATTQDKTKKGKPKQVCRINGQHTGHFTQRCEEWIKMDPTERRSHCLENKLCLICLDPYQKGHKCQISEEILAKLLCDKDCGKRHRKGIVCAVQKDKKSCTEVQEIQSGKIESTVAYTARYKVPLKGSGDVIIFADSGSDVTFIHEKFAKNKNLKVLGQKTLNVKTLTGVKEVQCNIYEVPLKNVGIIVGHGVDSPLTSRTSVAPISKLKMIFPKYRNWNKLNQDSRPAEILLGLDYYNLHPQKCLYKHQTLSIMTGALGDTLVGSEPDEGGGNVSCHLITREQQAIWKKFIQGEELSVQVEPRCGACRCGHCPQVGTNYSFKGEQELRLIREGLHFDEDKGHWETKCPWIKPPETCPDNHHIALSVLKSTERKLEKVEDWRKTYSEQMTDMLDRKACKKLTKAEIEEWKGPFLYLCHQAVMSKSKSTPVRVVFNSSLSVKGVSLNDCLAKGPDNYLNSLINILIRFREYQGVIFGDISKFFHAIALAKEDQHMHRFLWRFDTKEQPNTYVMTKLNFGNVSSPCIAMEALFQTGERVRETEPEVTYVLKESSYMDDLIHSCEGNQLLLAQKVHKVLEAHGFLIKEWQLRGEKSTRTDKDLFRTEAEGIEAESPVNSEETVTQVLGVTWNPSEDYLLQKVELNFSPKKKGMRTGPNINKGDKLPIALTRRTVLEQVGKLFDPLGLIGPFVLKAKQLLRQTWDNNLDWDTELPSELYNQWIQWFRSCFDLEKIHFRRCCKPETVRNENPVLVIFSDGSTKASAYVAYVRWEISPDRYKSYLIMAKNRIAPRERVSVPRLELNGALLGARGRKTMIEACRYKFSKIIHLVDSETVLLQVSSLATKLPVYEGTRVGEVQRICNGEMQDWYWIPGEDNISDLNTRGKDPLELDSDSIWQNGPEFLERPIDEWPIKSVKEIRVTEVKQENMTEINKVEATRNRIVDFSRVSKWNVLVRAIARTIYCSRKRSFRMRLGGLDTKLLEEARLLILKEVQSSMKNVQENYKSLGVVKTTEGLWAVGARGVDSESYHELPILIPYQHKCSLLVMADAHEEAGHVGRDATLARCRQQYYMAQGAKLAKKIRNRCTKCRIRDKKKLTQLMGKVPLVSLKPAPVFNSVQLDLFGPWAVRGEVQKRTTGKVWGVLFVCLASRAVHIEIIAGYSTQDFLMGFKRFGSIRGYPQRIYSDPGSQLVGADKELKAIWKEMNLTDIQHTGVSKGTDWHFSPADSSHYQGLAEALIKTTKRAIKVMYSTNLRLSWQEWLTAAYQVADLINSRPIAQLGEIDEVLQVLTPNSLLMGRNSSTNPGYYLEKNSLPRLSDVNAAVQQFWKKWNQIAKPALTLHKKWNCEVRNLKVNDIVLVLESTELGTPVHKLAKVVKADPGSDGKVRSCQLMYKVFSSGDKGLLKYSAGTSTVVSRCCQRLVLIVPIEELRAHSNDY